MKNPASNESKRRWQDGKDMEHSNYGNRVRILERNKKWLIKWKWQNWLLEV